MNQPTRSRSRRPGMALPGEWEGMEGSPCTPPAALAILAPDVSWFPWKASGSLGGPALGGVWVRWLPQATLNHLKSSEIFFLHWSILVLTRRNCSKLLPRLLYCQSTWPGVWRMLSWPPHIVTWMLTDACRKLRTCAGQWLNWIYAWASWGVWTLDQVRVWQDGAFWRADMLSASQCQLWTWTWMNGHFSGEWVVCIQ